MRHWLLLLAAGSASAAAEDDRQILQHVNENPRLRAESAVIEGRLCAERYTAIDCDYPVRVSLERRGEFLEVSTASSDRRASVRIPLSRLPELDLESAEINGHYRPEELVTVRLRFGQPNDCFVNDDGRAQLSISLGEEYGARAWITSYEGCEIRDEQIVGGHASEADHQ